MSDVKNYYILTSKKYGAIYILYILVASAAFIYGFTETRIYYELTGGHFGTSSNALFLPLLIVHLSVLLFESCRRRVLKKRGFTFEDERNESPEIALSPEEIQDAKARDRHSMKVLLPLLGAIILCLATVIGFAGGWKF